MKIVAVVPMKLNNTRLPQKNIKPFTNGKPLCHYILSTLLTVEKINDIYVYCSNSDIKEYIPEGIKYLTRSEELDKNTASISDVLSSFAKDVPADIYILAHTTAPFIKKESIEKGIDSILSGKYDSAFAAQKVQDFLWCNGKPMNYDLTNIPRTQDLDPIYKETCGLYIYTNEVIKNTNRRIGKRPYIIETGEIEGIDIDEKEDFMIADAVFNYMLKEKEDIACNGSIKVTGGE